MTTLMRMLWHFLTFPFMLGIVPTSATIEKVRYEVVGSYRKMVATVSVPNALAYAVVTPFHIIYSVKTVARTQTAVGAGTSINYSGGIAPQLQVNLACAATPTNGIEVEVIGL